MAAAVALRLEPVARLGDDGGQLVILVLAVVVPPRHVALHAGRPAVVEAVGHLQRGHQHGVIHQVALEVPGGEDILPLNRHILHSLGRFQDRGRLQHFGGLHGCQGVGPGQGGEGIFGGCCHCIGLDRQLYRRARRLVALDIFDAYQGHNVFDAIIRIGGIAGAVVLFLHPVVGDEPGLHLVGAVLGRSQIGRPRAERAAEAANRHIGMTRLDGLAVLCNQLCRPTDGHIVAAIGREEHPLAGHKAEKDSSVLPGLFRSGEDGDCRDVRYLKKAHQ